MTQPRLYPLSQTQRLNMWSRSFTVHKQVNNIATSALVEAPLDLVALRAAAVEAVSRNDSFGVRLTKRGRQQRQYFGERRALVLETVDFEGRSEAEMDAFFHKVARKPLPIWESPLAKVYIVRAPDGACGLFTCISHFVMDSWAINLFYRDVFGLYFAHVDGEPLPDPVLPFEDQLKKEAEYEASPRHDRDREFWRGELASYDGRLPAYAHVNGTRMRDSWRKLIRKPDHPFGRGVIFRTTARHEVIGVDRADLDAMKAFCEEHRIPLPSLFLLGLRTHLSRVSGNVDDVSIAITIARRGTLVEKRSTGDRATGLHLRTIIGKDQTFLDALRIVGYKQNSMLGHADIDFLEIMAMETEAYGIKAYEAYAPIVFTFQMIPMEVGNGLAVRTEWYCSGTSQMMLYVMVMGGGADDSLRICYEYYDYQIDVATLHQCHAFTLDVIRAGIRNPDVTMAELLELPLRTG